VRRMCEAVGHPVLALERVAFGPVRLDGLAPGAHRPLTSAEVEDLRTVAGGLPEDVSGRGVGRRKRVL
jgi:23S rRNA pseudouridine2605 synthase